MVHFLYTGRHFLFCPSVNNGHFRTQSQGGSCGIHSYVPAPNHSHPPAHVNGGVRIWRVGCHQVVSGKEFIGRNYPVEIFAGNAHEFGQPGSGSHKNSIKTLMLHQLVNGDAPANHNVAFYLYTQLLHLSYLIFHHFFLRQTEFRDSVHQYPARFVQGFKDGNITSGFCQVGGTGKPGRAGTDHRHLFPVWNNCGRC